MARYVITTPIPITVDGDAVPAEDRDYIFILPKLSFGARENLVSAAERFELAPGGGLINNTDMGAWNKALLQEFITGWQGPGFATYPYSPEAVLGLDLDDPLVAAVFTECQRRVMDRRVPDPNARPTSPGTNGSPSAGGPSSLAASTESTPTDA